MSTQKQANKGNIRLWLMGGAVLVLIVATVLLIGQLGGERNSVDDVQGTFTLSVSALTDLGDGTGEDIHMLYSELLNVDLEKSLMDIMKDNLALEEDAGMITSLCGVAQDAEQGKYWTYKINGEYAQIGAADYTPRADDNIEFSLFPFDDDASESTEESSSVSE